jgi:hypothetical protein
MEKSSIIFHALSEDIRGHLRSILPFEYINIEVGIKYLGFYLKQIHSHSMIGCGSSRKSRPGLECA